MLSHGHPPLQDYMPVQWLASNTHFLGLPDFNWPSCSMGKGINTLHDALVMIDMDGKLLLDEPFIEKHMFKDPH